MKTCKTNLIVDFIRCLRILLISVLMSIYNNQSTLGKSVHSILNQNYKNFEFLIVDDNSTDNSFMMLRNLAKNDKRIKVLKMIKILA